MNSDEKWQRLLAQSTPTFTGEAEPPFGFITGTLARLRTERQQEEAERIGWRALLASFGALAVAAAITVTVNLHQTAANDLEPGVRSIVQMENIPVS